MSNKEQKILLLTPCYIGNQDYSDYSIKFPQGRYHLDNQNGPDPNDVEVIVQEQEKVGLSQRINLFNILNNTNVKEK